jgi:hypothetical protein
VTAAGHIAVLSDHGDLLTRKNPLDLDGRGLRFTPGAAGYSVLPVTARTLETGGETVISGLDEVRLVPLPFAFSFFGRSYREVFVHADGLLSFEPVAPASADRSLPRLVSGPPAIAVFFADFAPDRGGSVSVRSSAAEAVITWTDLRAAPSSWRTSGWRRARASSA